MVAPHTRGRRMSWRVCPSCGIARQEPIDAVQPTKCSVCWGNAAREGLTAAWSALAVADRPGATQEGMAP
jgi:hypothetical protein